MIAINMTITKNSANTVLCQRDINRLRLSLLDPLSFQKVDQPLLRSHDLRTTACQPVVCSVHSGPLTFLK